MLMSMQMGRMDLSELDYDDDNDYFSRVDYDEDGRIGGGRLSSRAYQAALLVKKGDSYNLMCGGVIISDQWILTAAHCVADQTDLKRRLVMGTNDLKQGKGRSVRVEKVIVHQNYVPFDPITRPLAPLNDIALLRVQVPLPTQVSCCFKAIKLPDKQSAVPVGSSGIVSGYGSTSHLIKTTARLLEADVEILADEKCTFYWGAEFTSTSMTCAIGQGNRGICKGDSGKRGCLSLRLKLLPQEIYSSYNCSILLVDQAALWSSYRRMNPSSGD